MTDLPIAIGCIALVLIGYALAGVRRAIAERRRMFRRDMPVTDALFHPSHLPGSPEPEPFPIDWHAMRNRKVGR